MNTAQPSEALQSRREFLMNATALPTAFAITGFACGNAVADNHGEPAQTSSWSTVRFGLNADPHLMGRGTAGHEANFLRFVDEVKRREPDFAIDLGDFGCQCAEGTTTRQMHDCQLEALEHHVSVFEQVPCQRYHVIGNHDVGWLRGGEEVINPEDLISNKHSGEDITKNEFLKATGTPNRYYSFDTHGIHFMVLDGNNARDDASPPAGNDGVAGAYFIDAKQLQWIESDLATHRQKPKIVFCHEELHHTPVKGSGEGGDVPFSRIGKEISYVDNGWQVRRLFASDGRVLACFFGHKHRNRWTVYEGVNYITMAATHWKASFAAVTVAGRLSIEGFGGQKSYDLPLPKKLAQSRNPA